jgi:hypothetical protein
VPLAETKRYASDLRSRLDLGEAAVEIDTVDLVLRGDLLGDGAGASPSITQGRGAFDLTFDHYRTRATSSATSTRSARSAEC